MDKIKVLKILDSKNSITPLLRMPILLKEKIETKPHSFDSFNKIQNCTFRDKNNFININCIDNTSSGSGSISNSNYNCVKPETAAEEHAPVITSVNFIPFRDNCCSSIANIEFISTTSTTNSYSYDYDNKNNDYQFRNLHKNATKSMYDFDNHYKENSQKNSNDDLLNKGY